MSSLPGESLAQGRPWRVDDAAYRCTRRRNDDVDSAVQTGSANTPRRCRSRARIGGQSNDLGYCSRNLTDGFIPAEMVRRLIDQDELESLCFAGFLHKSPGGYTIHDYLEWQTPRESIEREACCWASRRPEITPSEAGSKC